MTRSDSRSDATSKGAKVDGPLASRPTSFEALPALLKSWPKVMPTTGKSGFSSPDLWLKEVGPQVGVTSKQQLNKRIAEGDIPAVPISHLTRSSGLAITGKAGESLLVANDPVPARPDPGQLRAIASMKAKDGTLVSMPTKSTATFGDTVDAREKSSREAVQEALARAGGVAPSSVRLAWVTQDPNQVTKVRLVEYRDASGEPIVPNQKQDLEALVAKADRTDLYSPEDFRRDVAARVHASQSTVGATSARRPPSPPRNEVSAPGSEPAQKTIAAPAPMVGSPSVRPASGSPPPQAAPAPAATSKASEESRVHASAVSNPATPSGKASESAPVATSAQSVAPKASAGSLHEGMLASQQVDVSVAPTKDTPHVLRVFPGRANLDEALSSSANGVASIAAGVQSGFKPLLLDGNGGEMRAGSQVILGVRSGSEVQLVGYAPYAGIEQGAGNAGRLRIQADRVRYFSEPPVVRNIGAANQPVPVKPTSDSSTFQVPAEGRRAVHAAFNKAIGME